jgi:hypothetical protein
MSNERCEIQELDESGNPRSRALTKASASRDEIQREIRMWKPGSSSKPALERRLGLDRAPGKRERDCVKERHYAMVGVDFKSASETIDRLFISPVADRGDAKSEMSLERSWIKRAEPKARSASKATALGLPAKAI